MSDHLNNLSPEKLAGDRFFQKWVLKSDPEAAAFWNRWLEENTDQCAVVEKAKVLLVLNGERFRFISDDEVSAEIYKLSHSIGARSGQTFLAPLRHRIFPVAASVLILIMGIAGWHTIFKKNKSETVAYAVLLNKLENKYTRYQNVTGNDTVISLADASKVTLKAHARITVPQSYNQDKREIFLEGEAFFDVKPDNRKPFYVYANDLVTKVLGTSFKVVTSGTGTVKVEVKTGRVTVFPVTKEKAESRNWNVNMEEGMILTPNQQIVYQPNDANLKRSLVETPEILVPAKGQTQMIFKKTPIREVFGALETSYGIRIVYDDKTLSNCYLNAVLENESLLDKIELICKTINASYRQIDGAIVIDGDGCR